MIKRVKNFIDNVRELIQESGFDWGNPGQLTIDNSIELKTMKTENKHLFFLLFTTSLLILLLLPSTLLLAITLHEVSNAGPPIVTEDGILFSFKSEKKVPRYVMVSGDFNNWGEPLLMIKNRHGVFVYLYNRLDERSVVLKEGKYRYRFLVDGIWMKDLRNEKSVYDSYGTELSYFEIRMPLIILDKNPVHIAKNRYIFYYRDPEARNVFIVGDFNNWNPYSHPMYKKKTGFWILELDLLPGSHAYRFLVDGIYRKDPLSKDIVLDQFDNEYTHINVPHMD